MNEVRTLLMLFNTPLSRKELPWFRGAVIKLLPRQNILYHNHAQEGLRYAYPLIQYKCIGGKAALLCVADGVEAIGHLLEAKALNITIGQRPETLQIKRIDATRHNVQESSTPITYQLRDWLPLNGKNYERFAAEEGVAERIRLLEGTLTGNILSMLKGVGIYLGFTLRTTITSVAPMHRISYKGVQLLAMDIQFKTNVSLPEHIGLGRHASIGYGTLNRISKY